MNAYWIDGGNVERISYDPPDYDSYRLCGIFCAETSGQAKYDALVEFNNDCEWNDLSARLLTRGLDLPRGVFDENCPEGPWDDDETIAPPEPWATVWAALTALQAKVA